MCAIRAPAMPAENPATREGEALVAIERDAVAARRHVVVADRAQGAPEMRAEQPVLQQRQHDQRASAIS